MESEVRSDSWQVNRLRWIELFFKGVRGFVMTFSMRTQQRYDMVVMDWMDAAVMSVGV